MTVGIFINGLKLDLFQDENIELNLSAQNVKDITKFYSDYTQSFTVPASKKNNIVFAHWYDSDIEQFNANVKIQGHIEVDGLLFKEGVYLLEKANKKDGNIYSYTIAFSTAISSLKDIIGDATLQDVDYGQIQYNETEVRTIIGQNYGYVALGNPCFPLISSNKVWTYGDATATDITTTTGAIKWNELFPALNLKKIFESVEAQYNVDFGSFIDDQFNVFNLIWFKNKNLVGGVVPLTTAESFTNEYVFYNPNGSDTLTKNISVNVITTYTGNLTLRVYKNGVITNAVSVNGNGGTNVFNLGALDVNDLSTYKFGIITGTALTSFAVNVVQSGLFSFSLGTLPYSTTYNNTITTTGDMQFSQFAPKVKIMDFIKNYLTLINGVIHYKDGSYIIEPLERYYTRGKVIDITPHVNIDSVEYSRVKLPKKLSFKHAENSAVSNYNYNSLNNPIEYGNTSEVYDYDGGELTFESGFEVMQFNQLQNDLWVGYSLDKDFKEITPKLQLLGFTTNTSQTFKLNTTDITTAMVFTEQYASFGGVNDWQSNTFSVENGVNGIETNTLYQTFYLPYIGGLFNNKNRQVSINGVLPFDLVHNLKLYDAIVFDQKQYTINDMKLNLVNGKFTATLLTNFRPQYRSVIYNIDELAHTINHTVINPLGYGTTILNDYTPQAWVSIPLANETTITFDVLALPSGQDVRIFRISYVLFQDGAPTFERCRITIIQTRIGIPANALLTEDGIPILTEDNQYIITE